MRGRTSGLVLAAGFAAVLALAIVLVQATRGARSAAPTHRPPGPPIARPAPAPIAIAPAAAPARPLAARAALPSVAWPRAAAAPTQQPELPAPRTAGQHELKRDANGHLVPLIALDQLRAQRDRTDAPMQACLARAGQPPTGSATLSFTVTARDGKLVIESTGVDDADTLAVYPELLECMHRTAHALALDGQPIPELGTPIYVRRHVRIDRGALAENSFFNFSYSP